jgi:choline-sulfatase
MTEAANLIFFLSDNHTRDLTGAAGHPMVQTPNIDALAATGTRFENAYCVSPLCCPSRASLATGRYPHETGYWDNAIVYDGKVPSWHHRIREQGHDVTAIGKLHFRSPNDDNGFTDEIDVMHIVEERGALITSLRATEGGVPSRRSHYALYEDSGPGEADYQIYDRRISDQAIEWLEQRKQISGKPNGKPWVLLVSYPSPHPPFRVPERFWDLYPVDDVPLPVQWRPGERPNHPAVEYIAWMNSFDGDLDEAFVRRVIAGYYALITHTDEQIGLVMQAAKKLGLMDNTRFIYTSDHGEAAGHHGIFGKANHYDHSIAVPLVIAGPGIAEGRVVQQQTSHIDLFPTIVEAVGAQFDEADKDLPGTSLWNAINGDETHKSVFTEFHALGSRNAGFSLREGDHKLIYHVDMPNQLFDVANDPLEEHDLLLDDQNHAIAAALEAKLRTMVDPEEIDARAKADQLANADKFGGLEAARNAGTFAASPIPGKTVDSEAV